MVRMAMWWIAVFTLVALPVVGCSDESSGAGGSGAAGGAGGTCDTGGGVDSPYSGYQSALYAGLESWLCNPELSEEDDVCSSSNLDAMVVEAYGSTRLEAHVPSENPTFDCFYIYPTVSADEGDHSDLEANQEEMFIISDQAARLNQHCRVFAPLYRQITWVGPGTPQNWAIAYVDVLDAFKEYIANRNAGRGFVLFGHSQGTVHLRRLIAEEVESDPYLSERLIAAYLIGVPVEVPRGQDVGGTFASTPLCRSADQFGCVVSYLTFRASDPPAERLFFGDELPVCVNPAALTGGPAILDSYFPSVIPGLWGTLIGDSMSPWADPEGHGPIDTPYFKMSGFLEAECVEQESGISYLAVTPQADPADPRADDITGDFEEGWGLHFVDVMVAMGDILNLIEGQAASWHAQQCR